MSPDDARHDQLSDWLDGELEPEAEAALLAAIECDPDLARDAAALGQLIEQLRALPRAVEPERDLWPQIAGRVRHAELTRPRRRWIAAAALAAGLVGAFALGRWSPRPYLAQESTGSPQPPVTELAGPQAGSGRPAFSAFTPAERSLAATCASLRSAFEARRGQLPAATVALVERNLETIDSAIAEIEAALAARPGDRDLGRTLLAYQQRQIDLLSQVQRAARL